MPHPRPPRPRAGPARRSAGMRRLGQLHHRRAGAADLHRPRHRRLGAAGTRREPGRPQPVRAVRHRRRGAGARGRGGRPLAHPREPGRHRPEVRVSEGQRVAAGDLLAELDTRAAAIALRAAEAELAEAQARRTALDARRTAQLRQTERMRRAAKEQAISPQALDETEAALAALTADLRLGDAALAQATAKMETARYEMEQRQVRAPVAGIVAGATSRRAMSCRVPP